MAQVSQDSTTVVPSVAITFLVASEPIFLLPARTQTAIQARGRSIRRRRVEVLAQGKIVKADPSPATWLKLPAPKPAVRETAVTARPSMIHTTTQRARIGLMESYPDAKTPNQAHSMALADFLANGKSQRIPLTAKELALFEAVRR